MQADPDHDAKKAEFYLRTLCSVTPHRRTGSPGNQEATSFFAHTLRPWGYEIDTTPFPCLDHICGEASLTCHEDAYEVYVSPYSLGCDVSAELVTVSTVEELERVNCEGKILLMKGALCAEQLMPKNFVFYNPEHHQNIIALLESRGPAGIVAATGRNPEQVGALDPFPLIADGDFDIPSVCCREGVGEALAAREGSPFRLKIDARRLPSSATNVIASLNRGAVGKIVITAHIDAYDGTPGASDNASGVAVLLLVAETLSDYRGEHCIEIAALNGEDHYSAGGQMDYLRRYGGEISSTLLAINLDGLGYKHGKSSYSFYGCPPQLEGKMRDIFRRSDGLMEGEPWFSGDHMLFVQNGVPSVAFTSEHASTLLRTVTHTSLDTPVILDAHRLVEVAVSLNDLVRAL